MCTPVNTNTGGCERAHRTKTTSSHAGAHNSPPCPPYRCRSADREMTRRWRHTHVKRVHAVAHPSACVHNIYPRRTHARTPTLCYYNTHTHNVPILRCTCAANIMSVRCRRAAYAECDFRNGNDRRPMVSQNIND